MKSRGGLEGRFARGSSPLPLRAGTGRSCRELLVLFPASAREYRRTAAHALLAPQFRMLTRALNTAVASTHGNPTASSGAVSCDRGPPAHEMITVRLKIRGGSIATARPPSSRRVASGRSETLTHRNIVVIIYLFYSNLNYYNYCFLFAGVICLWDLDFRDVVGAGERRYRNCTELVRSGLGSGGQK